MNIFKKNKPDYTLFFILGLLVIFGVIILTSASAVTSQDTYGNPHTMINRQLTRGLLPGVFALIVAYNIPYFKWKKLSFLFLIISIVFLALVLIPGIGSTYNGARRWINIAGLTTFQPSELLKLTMTIYLAAWFDTKGKKVSNFSEGLIPFLVILAVIAFLIIMQPDIGTLGVITLTAIAIYFAAGAKLSHMALIAVSGIAALATLIKIAPYRMARLTIYLHPELDPLGAGYQINQALLALGSGGILGLGLGQSRQKFNYLPEPVSDSIFAIFGEELGFIGASGLIILFLFLIIKGFSISKSAPDEFGKLLACGISCWICFQAYINIAAICGLIPLTGVPLPFVSLGGTALIVSLFGMGILLNISKYTTRN